MDPHQLVNYYDDNPNAVARYDALHADQTADVAFYVEEAHRNGGPVLEIGCGTGRVTLAVAATGIPIVGLDRSRWMVAMAARKLRRADPTVRTRCRLLRADMRALGFQRPFRQVFLPFRVFQTLASIDEQLTALSEIRRVLAPNGRLVFDVFNPSPELLSTAGAPAELGETGRTIEADGETIREKAVVNYHLETQMLDVTFIYERESDTGGVAARRYESFRMRYFYRYEIEHLLARAGYEVESAYGNWNRESLGSDGEMIWIARPMTKGAP